MKKLFFILLSIFTIQSFAQNIPDCPMYQNKMDGTYCGLNGGRGTGDSTEYTVPTYTKDGKVYIKPFVCTVKSYYQSSVDGFGIKYMVSLYNVTLHQPSDISTYNNRLDGITTKDKAFMFKSSGGEVETPEWGVNLHIQNMGCSPYDPDCRDEAGIIISCRELPV